MARKIERKQLRKPDEFVGVATRVLDWIAGHRSALGIGVLAVLLLLFGVMTVVYLRRAAQVDESRPLLSAVNVRSFALRPDDQIETLGSPPGTLADFDRKALDAAVAESDDDGIGGIASLPAAGMALAEGNAGRAEALYRRYLSADGSLTSPGRLIAQEGLGYALERAGKPVEADAAFARIGDLEDGAYRALSLYHRGRIAAAQRRVEEAKSLLAEAKALEDPRPAGVTERIDLQLRLIGRSSAPAAVATPDESGE